MYYNSFNEAMKARFGKKVYKIALEGGFTCPTRDGSLGTRGCIFCSCKGSGDFAEPFSGDIHAQIERAKERVAAKSKGGPFVAYFQNYTNTYGPVEKLDRIFTEAISHPEVVALSIGTRPDCLPEETLDLLGALNKIKPVWVELGLQTIDPKSAKYIRRGFDLPCYDRAVRELKARGIEVIVHMIIGLPGESAEDIYATAAYISKSGADGIKLQLLHVLRGTDLLADYEAGKFEVLEMDAYIAILAGCIRRLRPEIVIHRMTGDGPKKDLAAPLWSADKKNVLNSINRAFREWNLVQGELAEPLPGME
ncbi:MAG: TIGR01212 family radical SAM protein [Clostridiales bacterium]|nr:TIGR01212 family radical SAM protein [Clostridiales bacterium]